MGRLAQRNLGGDFLLKLEVGSVVSFEYSLYSLYMDLSTLICTFVGGPLRNATGNQTEEVS